MSTETELKLLTLLNVSAIKRPLEVDKPGGYRASPKSARRDNVENGHLETPSRKLSGIMSSPKSEQKVVKKRRSVVFGGEVGPSGSTYSAEKSKKRKSEGSTTSNAPPSQNPKGKANGISQREVEAFAGLEDLVEGDSDDDDEEDSSAKAESSKTGRDSWIDHFAADTSLLSPEGIKAVNEQVWSSTKLAIEGFGRGVEQYPGAASTAPTYETANRMTPSVLESLRSSSPPPLISKALRHLGTYKDLYLHSLDGEADGSEKVMYGPEKEALRKAAVVHALNHVLKTRKRIIRNNEKLAHQSSTSPADMPDPPRDQSFTRPSTLFLLPLRSLALHYLSTHLFPLAPIGTQIENQKPFTTHFSVPTEEDPLAEDSARANFPIDHLVNFRGNSDDNFRFGVKFTRKAWRVIMPPAGEEKLMECDILIASPLGLKMAADREDSTDLLSSIEVAVVDGADVLGMQNWDHVKFVFEHLNEIPKNPHGCDFGRVKPWYLESQAKYLRQTILLSRYDTPELRAIWNRHCSNLAGKIRLEPPPLSGVLSRVKSGVKQTFERVDLGLKAGEGAVEEVDKRLEWFLKKTLPMLQRSAISRSNTLIVVPSYFDFVRLSNALRKMESIKFAAISEYSSNSEIGKARTIFFKSKVPFLLITERFHFYRRYIIRGARSVVWYQLPEHAQFYSEFLHMPLIPSRKQLEEGLEEVEPEEIRSYVLFSKYDSMRLERVVGTGDARKMVSSGEGRFEFA